MGAAETHGKTHIVRLDGNAMGMDGASVGVIEKTDKVSLSSLLESSDGGRLETEVVLDGGGDFTNKTLEGEFADEELGGTLVATDITESDGTWAETVNLLDGTGRNGLLGGLLSEMLARHLARGGLAGSHLSTNHFELFNEKSKEKKVKKKFK